MASVENIDCVVDPATIHAKVSPKAYCANDRVTYELAPSRQKLEYSTDAIRLKMVHKMNLLLNKSEDELREKFSSLRNLNEVASLIDITPKKLAYYLYKLPDDKKYVYFDISKKSGKIRTITAPNVGLKIIQRKLAQVLNSVYKPKWCVRGFVINRNIVSNAKPHCKKNFVLNLDLEDFFPTIHFGRIRGMFQAVPYNLNVKVAEVLANICCCDKRLPQGAPTSPILSNMICSKMDSELKQLAKALKCKYTRYADDLTFSTHLPEFPIELVRYERNSSRNEIVVGDKLRSIIENNRFKINHDKIRLQKANHRQAVTGLIVNRFPNVKRKFIRQIRAMLHAWEKYGLDKAEREYHEKFSMRNNPNKKLACFKDIVKGKIEFLGMIRGKDNPMYCAFIDKYNSLDKEIKERVIKYRMPPDKTKELRDVFLCHASKDKKDYIVPFLDKLHEEGITYWYDEAEIKWGDSLVRKISEGIKKSKFVLVFLTKNFTDRNWTEKEMNAALSIEVNSGVTKVLPLLIGSKNETAFILDKYPLLNDKKFKLWEDGISSIIDALKERMFPG